jgi:hypothetical protein
MSDRAAFSSLEEHAGALLGAEPSAAFSEHLVSDGVAALCSDDS